MKSRPERFTITLSSTAIFWAFFQWSMKSGENSGYKDPMVKKWRESPQFSIISWRLHDVPNTATTDD